MQKRIEDRRRCHNDSFLLSLAVLAKNRQLEMMAGTSLMMGIAATFQDFVPLPGQKAN